MHSDIVHLPYNLGSKSLRRTLLLMKRHPARAARLEATTSHATHLDRADIDSTAEQRAAAWAAVEAAHAALADADTQASVEAPVGVRAARPRQHSRRRRVARVADDDGPHAPFLDLQHQVDPLQAQQVARELARTLVSQALRELGLKGRT